VYEEHLMAPSTRDFQKTTEVSDSSDTTPARMF
jgi:hypothetical protein